LAGWICAFLPPVTDVSSFVESLALRPLDTGDLRMAHWLEEAGLLMIAPGLGKAVKDHNFWLGIKTLG
jgi:8-hydroxy-5-deazaflavin:NADPH oxidoreductase